MGARTDGRQDTPVDEAPDLPERSQPDVRGTSAVAGPPRVRWAWAGLALAMLVLVVTVIARPGTIRSPGSAPEDPAPPASAVAARVLPVTGTGALFGYYQTGLADVRPMETSVARRFDAVHRYYDFNALDAVFPTPADDALSAGGRTVHIGWEMQSYNGSYDAALQPAPAAAAPLAGGGTRKVWTYSQILNGSMDRYLDAVAARLNASPYDYIIDLQHEVDDQPDVGGSNAIRAASGSRADFAASYRHVVDRFRAAGVDNVVWSWTMAGFAAANKANWPGYRKLWPGRGYVDIIMWDPYNNSRQDWRSFTTIVTAFYRSLMDGMLDRVDASAKNLPLGLAEWGCVPDPRRSEWLRSVPVEMRSFPQLVYANYFSSGSRASLQGDPAAIDAFATAGRDSWFRPRR